MNLNTCIFCDLSENLNTQMTITTEDGNKVMVKICDSHAEDATVRSAKEAYAVKRKKIDELMAQARALGLQISDSPSGLSIVTEQEVRRPQQKSAELDDLIDIRSENVVPTSKLAYRDFVTSGGNVSGQDISTHNSHDLGSVAGQLPNGALEGYAEMALVEGRSGQPLSIPQKRVDGTGMTRIVINKSENDSKLQDRFKKMASDSMADRTPDFARQGYQNTTRQCPICRGSGFIKQKKIDQQCPKCSGTGILTIY